MLQSRRQRQSFHRHNHGTAHKEEDQQHAKERKQRAFAIRNVCQTESEVLSFLFLRKVCHKNRIQGHLFQWDLCTLSSELGLCL